MRLIDAEALENKLVKTMRYVPKNAVLDVACMVNRAPTVEAKPIVHAHWEKWGCEGTVCSNCYGRVLYECDEQEKKSKFCPHCGAQMDFSEEKDE